MREGCTRRGRVSSRGRMGDSGQALPFVAVLVVVAGLLGIGATHLGLAEVARGRAQAAADAAALAGAAHDRAAAAELATADGASLVSFRRMGTDVVVTVELGGMQASSRARAVRGPPLARWDANQLRRGRLVCSRGDSRRRRATRRGCHPRAALGFARDGAAAVDDRSGSSPRRRSAEQHPRTRSLGRALARSAFSERAGDRGGAPAGFAGVGHRRHCQTGGPTACAGDPRTSGHGHGRCLARSSRGYLR